MQDTPFLFVSLTPLIKRYSPSKKKHLMTNSQMLTSINLEKVAKNILKKENANTTTKLNYIIKKSKRLPTTNYYA